MKKSKVLIMGIILAVIVVGASTLYDYLTVRTTAESQAQPQTTTKLAPDFAVYDAEGNAVYLSDLRGKPVIVNFWATWCGYCVSEMPEFQAAYETYGDQIHFMMVNVTDGQQETKKKAMEFLAGTEYTFPVYYDLELSASKNYGVNAMPVTYFIGPNGEAVAWTQGAINAATLQKGIDMLLDMQ